MASIPKDRAGVFSYSIKWEALDSASQDVKDRIAGVLLGEQGCPLGLQTARSLVRNLCRAHLPLQQLATGPCIHSAL